jgi:uncharacterized protein YbjT (DUF2867 family)
MYAIIGATGNTGSLVAEKLLARGEKVRVVGRDAQRLVRFTRKGAEPFIMPPMWTRLPKRFPA